MFKFSLFKPQEFLMIQLSTGTTQYVSDTAVQKRIENGWAVYTESGRNAPDYYVPDVLQFFGKMSYGKLPGIKALLWLLRVHKSYKNNLNFLNVAWGALSLGKLPTIPFIKIVLKDWYGELTDIARYISNFIIGLALMLPLCAGIGWLVVQYLTQ